MIIVGIDPGSRRTGFAAVRSEGARVFAVEYATISLPNADLWVRLPELHAQLAERLGRLRPDRVVLESLFHHKNARSALVLGHARGVALLAAGQCGARVGELSPAEIKRGITGSGRADKHQVQQMVRAILGLDEAPAADAADALAAAIAGAHAAAFTELRA